MSSPLIVAIGTVDSRSGRWMREPVTTTSVGTSAAGCAAAASQGMTLPFASWQAGAVCAAASVGKPARAPTSAVAPRYLVMVINVPLVAVNRTELEPLLPHQPADASRNMNAR